MKKIFKNFVFINQPQSISAWLKWNVFFCKIFELKEKKIVNLKIIVAALQEYKNIVKIKIKTKRYSKKIFPMK